MIAVSFMGISYGRFPATARLISFTLRCKSMMSDRCSTAGLFLLGLLVCGGSGQSLCYCALHPLPACPAARRDDMTPITPLATGTISKRPKVYIGQTRT